MALMTTPAGPVGRHGNKNDRQRDVNVSTADPERTSWRQHGGGWGQLSGLALSLEEAMHGEARLTCHKVGYRLRKTATLTGYGDVACCGDATVDRVDWQAWRDTG